MTDDTRLLAEADRSARAARRARVEGRCVHCHEPYEPGVWIVLTDNGTIHRACLPRPERIGRPRKPKRATAPAAPTEATRIVTARRRGRCRTCTGTFYAGDTIAFIAGNPVHAACAPQPVNVTQLTPA